MPRVKKKLVEGEGAVSYPVLDWTAENFSLTWAMITALGEFDAI